MGPLSGQGRVLALAWPIALGGACEGRAVTALNRIGGRFGLVWLE